MTKQNYRVVLASDDEQISHAIKRHANASTMAGRPFAKPDVLRSTAAEAARTVANLWKSMGLDSGDELDQAKINMAEQFAETKLEDLGKLYRFQPIGIKTFDNAYWDTSKSLGYNIPDGSSRMSRLFGLPSKRKGVFGRA